MEFYHSGRQCRSEQLRKHTRKRPRRSRTSVQRSDGASPIIRDNIVLIRTDDNEEFKVGDTIEITQGKGPEDPTTEYGLITEIKFGNSEFIEVIVDWFIRSSEIVGMPNDFCRQ